MDRMTNYKQIVRREVQQYFDRYYGDDQYAYLLLDDNTGNYLVLLNGWRADERLQAVNMYVRVSDGLIWIEEDWSDYVIVDHLIDAGVPQDKIVLAFHHPSDRPFTEFAVA